MTISALPGDRMEWWKQKNHHIKTYLTKILVFAGQKMKQSAKIK
jgi:hypothetical protein